MHTIVYDGRIPPAKARMVKQGVSPMLYRPLFVAALALFATGCTPKLAGRFLPDASPTPLLLPRATPAPPTTEVKAAPVGVLVAFPVAGKAAQDFASGIGVYLTGAVAGAPEFGQSPLRATVGEVAGEQSEPSLCLSPIAARQFARRCGATHYGAGTYSENETGVTLTYKIRATGSDDVAASESITAPSREALMQTLPGFAQNLRAALGAPQSVVSVTPLDDISPDVLAKAGACASAVRFTAAQEAFLLDTGKRVPLVAELALYLFHDDTDPAESAPYTRLLWETQRSNTQTLGVIASRVPYTMDAGATAALYALAEQYPDSHPLAHAAALVAREQGDWNEEAMYCARSAQNAPGNPDAHMIAGTNLSRQIRRIQRAKELRGGDAETQKKLLPMYRDAAKPLFDGYRAELRAAIVCDPLHAHAYARLAETATIAGDFAEADTAMTMARKLRAKPLHSTYIGGMTLYGAKFANNPGKLRAVAEEAANASYPRNDVTLSVYKSLGKAGFADLQKRMSDRLLKEAAQTLARNPKDLYAHYLRGSLLSLRGKPGEAIRDFAANAKNYPANIGVHYMLGRAHEQAGNLEAAEKALREEKRRQPRDTDTLLALAGVLRKQNKLPQAIVFYENASHLSPLPPEATIALATSYNKTGRKDDTLTLGEAFLREHPGDEAMTELMIAAQPTETLPAR
ncbi:MAG: hypothetical protein H7Y38_18295 [Armatimonadetes bacterium]|nr:hypothetical protein [Armatimonadota bacterium]